MGPQQLAYVIYPLVLIHSGPGYLREIESKAEDVVTGLEIKGLLAKIG